MSNLRLFPEIETPMPRQKQKRPIRSNSILRQNLGINDLLYDGYVVISANHKEIADALFYSSAEKGKIFSSKFCRDLSNSDRAKTRTKVYYDIITKKDGPLVPILYDPQNWVTYRVSKGYVIDNQPES